MQEEPIQSPDLSSKKAKLAHVPAPSSLSESAAPQQQDGAKALQISEDPNTLASTPSSSEVGDILMSLGSVLLSGEGTSTGQEKLTWAPLHLFPFPKMFAPPMPNYAFLPCF